LKTYYDLVIEGPQDMIKGFIAGFIKGSRLEGEAVIVPEENIEQRSGLEHILRIMRLKESQSHLVAEQGLFTAIMEAVSSEREKIALRVVSYAQIVSAFFDFTLKAFSRQTADDIRKMLADIPDGVEIEYSNWLEEIRPEAKGPEAYAPEHEYELHASGRVKGNPAGIFELYERLESNELIELGLIRLEHGEAIPL